MAPVILFHAEFPLFSGGFVGVDVFFVISGYLITSIILSEKLAGTFSLSGFYERRARRILPALFVVMAACLIPAWLWMTPSQLVVFSESIVGVSIFASNILFWRTSGYFEDAAENIPLLHTWSLGVEEQYYVLFPLFVIVFFSQGYRRLAGFISFIAIVSFGLSEWGWRHHPTANFFLTPTRAWELLLGSLLAILSLATPLLSRVGKLQSEILAGTGLVLILGSVLCYSKSTPFPGFYALAPTLGTALILGFSKSNSIVGKFLAVRALVGLGAISYSAYLWHQPLFAFSRLYNLEKPSQTAYLLLIASTIGLATLTWRYVEQPFRNRATTSRLQVWVSAAAAFVLLIAVGLGGYFADGFKSRFTAEQRALLDFVYDYRDEYQLGSCLLDLEQRSTAFGTCTEYAKTNRDFVFLWGDSHAAHLFPGFKKALAGEATLVHLAAGLCPPILNPDVAGNPRCRSINDYVIARIAKESPSRVVLAARWSAYDLNGLEVTIRKLREAKVERIDLVGPVPRWNGGLPDVLSRFNIRFADLPWRTKKGLASGLDSLDLRMRQLSSEYGINYISPKSILCNEDGCVTRLGNNADSLVAWDSAHLTRAGSEFLVAQFPK